MIRAVADTHALVWAFLGDSRLSPAARVEFAGGVIGVSAISLAEILYLEEKGRLPAGTREGLNALLADSSVRLEEIPVAMPVVDAMTRIARDEVPDLPDRLIAATALSMAELPIASPIGFVASDGCLFGEVGFGPSRQESGSFDANDRRLTEHVLHHIHGRPPREPNAKQRAWFQMDDHAATVGDSTDHASGHYLHPRLVRELSTAIRRLVGTMAPRQIPTRCAFRVDVRR